ncbi:hypothetical protein [Enterovibrio norvegicus]|uniref:hypothetical protein n=1 Tax=Enterovibrio norvegicus TaxID=188144 RepID=UPI0024B1E35A|nr:hypothetical protein [Enterovibrio norvegicus]
MKAKILAIAAALISSSAIAETVDCTNMGIVGVYVEGKRDDNFFFQNRMVIKYSKDCGGKRWSHTDIDNRAMSGFLSIALAAKASGKKVNIATNTSTQTQLSNQLAYIGLVE